MKYVGGGAFTTQELSIDETITEVNDEIGIAREVIIRAMVNVSDDVKKDLRFATERLQDAEEHYMNYVRQKVKKALAHVPEEIQKQEYL